MKKRIGISLIFIIAFLLSACGKPPPMGDVFDISGSPNPLYYGYCGPATLKFTVSGPGDGLRINSIIVGYNLTSGSGVKVKTGTVTLASSPSDPPVTYTGSVTFSIAGGTGAVAPDVAILDFGDGKADFAATVYATLLSPPTTGSSEKYYFTSTKSVTVVPCLPTPTAPARPGVPGLTVVPPILPPMELVTPTPFPIALPPGPADKPTKDNDGPPPCDPNNPNCAP